METLKRPLLAAKTTDEDLKNLRYPMLASPKIDGVRALVVGGKLVSRSMKLIPNRHTQELFGRPELEGLDGELVVGNPWDKNLMQQTTSGVMSFEGKPAVRLYVFDKWNSGCTFVDRWIDATSSKYVKGPSYKVQPVSHIYVDTYDDITKHEALCLSLGYEGLMLRDPRGRYKQGRSTLREGILLKVKRFHDAEAIIIGYSALERNLNPQIVSEIGLSQRSSHQDGKVTDELLGSLLVRDMSSGIEFSIGSGFTEAQRCSLWEDRENLLGRVVKYKSFHIGVKDKPRFPIFLGFRSLLDL